MMDIKVGIKPVGINGLVAQFGKRLKREEAEFRGKEIMKEFSQNLTEEAKILDSAVVEGEDDLKALAADLQETDLFLVLQVGGLIQPLAGALGEMYKKPVAMVRSGVVNLDIAAYLRARGLEGYAPLDVAELNELISLLRARKAIGLTRILVITSTKLPSLSVISSAWDLEEIRERLSIGFELTSTERLFEEMEGIEITEAENLADKITAKSLEVNVERDNVINSARLYLALKRLMDEYGCNALTVNCGEPIFLHRKITPCLALTLLKDEGLAASCEADLSVLLAMIMLMNISGKSAFMGNLWILSAEDSLVRISHDVPGLKMEGLDGPEAPYSLYDFHGRGWGTTIYVDMKKGEQITFARFSPWAERILVSQGEIVECYPDVSCRVTIDVKVSDAKGLLHKAADYGHHFAVVYGDYATRITRLSEIMALEAEFA